MMKNMYGDKWVSRPYGTRILSPYNSLPALKCRASIMASLWDA
jgi:hypothetical protein